MVRMLAESAFFLAASILVFSIVLLPLSHANASIIDISGDATIPKATTKQLKLVVKLLDTVSRLEEKDKLAGIDLTIPITLIIPITVEGQNAQICIALLSGGNMTCQQIIIDSETQTVSLDVNGNSTMSDQAQSTSTNEATTVDATDQLKFAIKFIKKLPKLEKQGELNVTSVTIPLTFIIPIDIQSQNAQICLSILSSTDVNCQQIIVNSVNQTISTEPITNRTTVANSTASEFTNTTDSNTNMTAAESEDENIENTTDSAEPCETPCPEDQYCIQMCQPSGNSTEEDQ
jgi:hypothetical protein